MHGEDHEVSRTCVIKTIIDLGLFHPIVLAVGAGAVIGELPPRHLEPVCLRVRKPQRIGVKHSVDDAPAILADQVGVLVRVGVEVHGTVAIGFQHVHQPDPHQLVERVVDRSEGDIRHGLLHAGEDRFGGGVGRVAFQDV